MRSVERRGMDGAVGRWRFCQGGGGLKKTRRERGTRISVLGQVGLKGEGEEEGGEEAVFEAGQMPAAKGNK